MEDRRLPKEGGAAFTLRLHQSGRSHLEISPAKKTFRHNTEPVTLGQTLN
jgi:hypothetical protein